MGAHSATHAQQECRESTQTLRLHMRMGKLKPATGVNPLLQNSVQDFLGTSMGCTSCGPGSPELSKSYMDMASKLFTFTFTFYISASAHSPLLWPNFRHPFICLAVSREQ